jgi:ATP adenylyltransferase
MVMPYAHLDRLAALPVATAHELIDLAQRAEQALEKLYRPQGFNFGLNLGQAARRGGTPGRAALSVAVMKA